MRGAHLALLAPFAVALAVGLANGCALITCVEDDCAAATGSGGTTSSAGGAGGASVTATGTTSTGTAGAGGEGGQGGGECTTDCVSGACELEACQPRCTALAGNGQAVAFSPTSQSGTVFALQSTTQTDLVSITASSLGGGDTPTTIASGITAETLATAGDFIFYASSDGTLGAPCAGQQIAGGKLRGAASLSAQSLWMSQGGFELRSASCNVDASHSLGQFGGSTMGATTFNNGLRIAYTGNPSPSASSPQLCTLTYDGVSSFTAGDCFDTAPSGAVTMSGVAVTPDAGTILVAGNTDIWEVPWGESALAPLLVPGLTETTSIAATESAVFVARLTPPAGGGMLVRCPVGGPMSECRSYGAAPVGGMTQTKTQVFFTMGAKLCAWE
ncbi:MAG: hypothetical protein JNL21_28745 [Myxococcales bacterium]|nr:hypothetical protein [Myxococcales bacterium]